MPFSIVRSSIASASAEAVFCPASARSELHRFILGPAGSAAGQKVRHLSGFPGSRSFITRLDHLRCLAACVAYPPSSAFPRSFRDAFQHLSEEEVQLAELALYKSDLKMYKEFIIEALSAKSLVGING